MSQKVWDLAKSLTKYEKFVQVCLHSGQAVHISIQFDEFFDKAISKFILIQIELFFKKVAIQNLLGFLVDS